MSVIFRTLKKLKSESPDHKEDTKKLKKKHNVFSFTSILTSSRAILFLIFFILISGWVAVHIVDNIREKNRSISSSEMKSKNSIPADAELKQVKTVTEKPDSFIPPPPENIPVEEAETGESYLPGKITSREIPVRQHPPIGKGRTESVPTTQNSTLMSSIKTPSRAMPEDILVKNVRHSTKELQAEKLLASRYARYLPPVEKNAGEASFHTNLHPAASAKQSREIIAKRTMENVQRIHKEKSRKIANLVSRIQKSITNPDSTKRTSALLDQLALIKGKDDCYVLKLRAFYYMRQGDLDSAAHLLNRVLQKEKTDREAGINMAIIEIKNGKLTEAKNRLYRLREIYPHDILIPELIHKLGS